MINEQTKNWDAYYKMLAFGQMKHLEDNKDIKAFKQNADKLGGHGFEQFYMNELERNSKVPAREIDPEIFKPKRLYSMEADQKYKNYLEQAEQFKDDFEEYKEDKL